MKALLLAAFAILFIASFESIYACDQGTFDPAPSQRFEPKPIVVDSFSALNHDILILDVNDALNRRLAEGLWPKSFQAIPAGMIKSSTLTVQYEPIIGSIDHIAIRAIYSHDRNGSLQLAKSRYLESGYHLAAEITLNSYGFLIFWFDRSQGEPPKITMPTRIVN